MKQTIKERFPQWVNDTNEKGKYNLCMSDDLDSLLSCYMLDRFFGYKVKYFYNFEQMYGSNVSNQKETIYVDIAIEGKGMAWDNHVVSIQKNDIINPNSANLNAINRIHCDNYYTKYCGSTLLQIMSYYNIPLPKDRERLLVLLAIDSSYLGHYDMRYKQVHNQYFIHLGFEHLIEFLDSVTKQDFNKVNSKYSLKSKINLNTNGKLETNIKLEMLSELFGFKLSLPEISFIEKEQFTRGTYYIDSSVTYKPNVFSFALTAKDRFQYTKK